MNPRPRKSPAGKGGPGTRHFIGPLTPAQQERRRRAIYRFRDIAEIMDARYCNFVEAARVLRIQHQHRFAPLLPERYATS